MMYTSPYLRCLESHRVEKVVREIHDGTYNSHIGERILAYRIHTQGYYWPTLRKDTEAYTKACDTCLCFGDIIHVMAGSLHLTGSPNTFAIWAIDIVRPLPSTPTQKKFLHVAMNYFTKWAEVQAFSHIKAHQLIKIIWKNIVCRLELPLLIFSDNGP